MANVLPDSLQLDGQVICECPSQKQRSVGLIKQVDSETVVVKIGVQLVSFRRSDGRSIGEALPGCFIRVGTEAELDEAVFDALHRRLTQDYQLKIDRQDKQKLARIFHFLRSEKALWFGSHSFGRSPNLTVSTRLHAYMPGGSVHRSSYF